MKQFAKAFNLSQFSSWSLIILSSSLIIAGCRKLDQQVRLKHFEQVNLVDNNHEYNAPNTDTTLVNAWGLAFNPGGVAWVASQAGHVSQVYDAEGVTLRPPVHIPSPADTIGGNPTGIIFNGGTGFMLPNGEPGRFLFVGVDGVLSGWNPTAGGKALLIQNNSATSAYTGLAIAKWEDSSYLYGADFRAGKIQVWDQQFNDVAMNFTDPALPAGFSPFNIQAVGDWLYVMYAKVGTDGEEEPGQGLGYVNIFKTNGEFVKRFASKGPLNAPWGVAKASASFFKGTTDSLMKTTNQDAILVGNFGNGYINAYTTDGDFIGQLRSKGSPIQIEGLWAITFAPSASSIDPGRLYFTAGPEDETEGLFGYIIKKDN
ncbi:MAG TPA: TIGR03118 family protein [Chryseolinea sp.]|nr:TIGR03118 family protein [Chryseolinea sp.]